MYSFRDTTGASGSQNRPSEALKLNGGYLEDQIDGYRTLYVSGRESLAPELELIETGRRDGAVLSGRRYPERVITVGYQLIAESPEAFREAYNRLGAILDTENAELIFDDEPDKYFTGTPSGLGDVPPGRCAVTSEILFTCTDPFKYSIEEKEVSPETDGSFVIDYKGTYKCYPTLEASFYTENDTTDDGEDENPLTGKGDCGFVTWFNQNEKVIFLGDEEEDGETFPESQTLVNSSFIKSTSWGTAAKKVWLVNSGTILNQDNHVKAGMIGVKHSYNTANEGTYYLTAATYGSNTAKYHGPSVARTIPADATGDAGASDFTVQCRLRMCIGNGSGAEKQMGCFQLLLTDSSGKIIAGVRVRKNATGKKGYLDFLVNGGAVKTVDIDLSYNNKYFGQDTSSQQSAKTIWITKSGAKVSFNAAGIRASFERPAVETAVVRKAAMTFEQLKQNAPLDYNGVSLFKFIKNHCTDWRDIPNKFSTGDVVTADCRNAEIRLNGIPAPSLGALGNDWEEFYLVRGVNQIGTAYSEWVEDNCAPEFKIRYREVFL